MGADTQGSEVALDLKHRQVFLGADDHRPDQVMPIPDPMIAFLTDEATPYVEEELLELLVVERTEGSHRLGGNGDFDFFAFLADDPRRIPFVPDLFPAILPQDFLPGILLGHLLDEELEGLGE